MPLLELIASAGFGSLLGMRHALEPDHLAAVSTLLSDERSSSKAALLGVCWGLGHTCALIVVGAVLVVLRAEMPARASDLFELGVALMLVGLGLRAIYLAARQGPSGPTHVHHHGPMVHRHAGTPAHVHIGRWTLARLTYMALFGLGSTLGMATLSGLLGWPIARLGQHRTVARSVSLAVGCLSTALGLAWGYPLVSRLF